MTAYGFAAAKGAELVRSRRAAKREARQQRLDALRPGMSWNDAAKVVVVSHPAAVVIGGFGAVFLASHFAAGVVEGRRLVAPGTPAVAPTPGAAPSQHGQSFQEKIFGLIGIVNPAFRVASSVANIEVPSLSGLGASIAEGVGSILAAPILAVIRTPFQIATEAGVAVGHTLLKTGRVSPLPGSVPTPAAVQHQLDSRAMTDWLNAENDREIRELRERQARAAASAAARADAAPRDGRVAASDPYPAANDPRGIPSIPPPPPPRNGKWWAWNGSEWESVP